MITEKKMALRPILESSEGIHLTAYLVNRGDLVDLKKQLRETIAEAYEFLYSGQTVEERKKFLEPLDALLKDARILKNMKGNIGIFRTKDLFRILNVPVELERQCRIASSFHVKPLLRWMQMDCEFLLLGLNENAAHLYLGGQTTFQKIDSILFPEFFKQKELLDDYLSLKKSRQLQSKRDETFIWLNEWLEEMTKKSAPRLFLAGNKILIEGLLKSLKYKNIVKNPIAPYFQEDRSGEICSKIRSVLKAEAKKTLDQALQEFRFAEEVKLGKKNIFQIAKAATQGRVKKLIVVDSMHVFGKVDKTTGGLEIHPFDLDHEDDDILDDLAQTVLASGGEVVVASKDELPKGRIILAILKHQGTDLEKSEELNEFETLQERASL